MTIITQEKQPRSKKKKFGEERYELRISGSGGHGVILAAIMLAEATAYDPRLNVVQTQSYGPEARGGASRADVVISTSDIYHPKTMKLDLLMAFTQEACDKYYQDLKPNGILIVDSNMVTKVPFKNSYAFPFMRTAREQVGHIMVANVIALGVIVELTGLIAPESIREVVGRRAPKGTEERNLQALEIGFDLAKKERRA